jgi:hypothetical protein
VDSDNPEEEPNNDTLYSSFVTTDFSYARHNGQVTGSFSNVPSNIGNPVSIGNTYDIFGEDWVCGIDVSVTSDESNIGKLIYGQIYILQDDGSYLLYVQTEDREIYPSEIGGFIHIQFAENMEHPSAFPGQTILAAVGHYGGEEEVRFNLAQRVEEQTVLGFTEGSTEPFFLTDPSAIMLNLELGWCWTGIEGQNSTFSLPQNSPNPCNETTILSYNLTQPSQVEIIVSDLTGKIMFQEIVENTSGGANTFELNTKNFAAGTYSYTFIINGESLTRKMMVVR